MADFIFLMHDTPNDTPNETTGWPAYLDGLARGGSAIGNGAAFRKDGAASSITAHLTGNPVYEAGGIVEIRELPETD